MPHIYAFQDIVPVIDPSAFVHDAAIVIGDVIIGPGCYIGPSASLRGDMGRITVRAGSNIQDNCVAHCFPGADTQLGEDCHIGHGAVLHGCVLGRNVLVGMNAVVMDGAVVGDNSIVGALAFVRAGDNIPPRTVVTGTPAKPRRELGDEEIGWKRSAGARSWPSWPGACDRCARSHLWRSRKLTGAVCRPAGSSLCTRLVEIEAASADGLKAGSDRRPSTRHAWTLGVNAPHRQPWQD